LQRSSGCLASSMPNATTQPCKFFCAAVHRSSPSGAPAAASFDACVACSTFPSVSLLLSLLLLPPCPHLNRWSGTGGAKGIRGRRPACSSDHEVCMCASTRRHVLCAATAAPEHMHLLTLCLQPARQAGGGAARLGQRRRVVCAKRRHVCTPARSDGCFANVCTRT
jgi:hypothetical protein